MNNYSRTLLQYAYIWTPYTTLKVPPKVDKILLENTKKEISNKINSLFVPSFNKTGLMGPNSTLFYNAAKFTRSNVFIMEKFLGHYDNSTDNERIRTIFKDLDNWQQGAIIAKERFEDLNRACESIYNIYILVE